MSVGRVGGRGEGPTDRGGGRRLTRGCGHDGSRRGECGCDARDLDEGEDEVTRGYMRLRTWMKEKTRTCPSGVSGMMRMITKGTIVSKSFVIRRSRRTSRVRSV